jgi:hypothetical protein
LEAAFANQTWHMEAKEAERNDKEAQRKQAESRREFLEATLSRTIVPDATYTAQGKFPCDDGTRADILAEIKKWAGDMTPDSPRLLWLNGAPGAGKSSITTSFASSLKKGGFLWAQFFISRNHQSTTNPNSIFPSIARQLVDRDKSSNSDVAVAIHDALKDEPALVCFITDSQAEELFVNPIKVALASDPLRPVVVVIDALDECGPEAGKTAQIISKTMKELPPGAKIFISSRVEDDIRRHFSSLSNTGHAKQINLDDSASAHEVSAFFRKQIDKMVEEEGEGWSSWPGEVRMKELCDKAAGLFIWAVTVINFIRARIKDVGLECRDEVLDELNVEGMDTIGDLYLTILMRLSKEEWAKEKFRQIVGAIIGLREPLPLSALKNLLDLRNPTSSSYVDINKFVQRFRTVLVPGAEPVNDHTTPRLHKSFIEFITSEHAGRFLVQKVALEEELGIRCLAQLNGLSRDKCEIEHLSVFNKDIPDLRSKINRHLGAHLRYACRYWSFHLPTLRAAIPCADSRDLSRLSKLRELFSTFFNEHLLHWIEAMSVLDYDGKPMSLLLQTAKEWALVRNYRHSCIL